MVSAVLLAWIQQLSHIGLPLWQYWLSSFQERCTKLDRFFTKSEHIPRIFDFFYDGMVTSPQNWSILLFRPLLLAGQSILLDPKNRDKYFGHLFLKDYLTTLFHLIYGTSTFNVVNN